MSSATAEDCPPPRSDPRRECARLPRGSFLRAIALNERRKQRVDEGLFAHGDDQRQGILLGLDRVPLGVLGDGSVDLESRMELRRVVSLDDVVFFDFDPGKLPAFRGNRIPLATTPKQMTCERRAI